jgi:hypothetical protein
MIPLPAHGLLGAFDEILFAGVTVIFLVATVHTWRRSRTFSPILEEDEENSSDNTEPAASEDHFELR